MGKIIAWLGAAILGRMTGLAGGWKTFFGVGLMAIIGIVFYNLAVDILEEILGWVLGKVSASTSGLNLGEMNITGLAGYFIQSFRIGECLSIMVSIIMLKWTLRKIPFIRW